MGMNIIDKVVGLLVLGAVLYYVFTDSSATNSILSGAATDFGTVEKSLQGRS